MHGRRFYLVVHLEKRMDRPIRPDDSVFHDRRLGHDQNILA